MEEPSQVTAKAGGQDVCSAMWNMTDVDPAFADFMPLH